MLLLGRVRGQEFFDRGVLNRTGALSYSIGLLLMVVTAIVEPMFTLAARRESIKAGFAVHGRQEPWKQGLPPRPVGS